MTTTQLIGLLPVGALMGNELGTLLIHRALFALDTDEHLAAEQAIHRVLGRVMPPYMIVAIVGSVVLTIAADDGGPTVLAATATGCLLTMLAITLIGNVPINHQTVALRRGVAPDHWRELRRRWSSFHRVRVALDTMAFLLAGLSIAAGT